MLNLSLPLLLQTLILFKDGQSYKYRGPRDVEGLSTFALSGYAAAEATKVEL